MHALGPILIYCANPVNMATLFLIRFNHTVKVNGAMMSTH